MARAPTLFPRHARARLGCVALGVLLATPSPSVVFAATRLRVGASGKGASSTAAPTAVSNAAKPAEAVASVSQFNGMPFLHEAKWEKGAGLKPKRQTQDAIYNGRRTRVIKLEQGLPLYDGDAVETPGDASMELLFPTGDIVLVHPGSHVELQDSPTGVDVRRGRVTLLTVSSSASALVLTARGQSFGSLGTGAFVDVGDAGVTQGNELRAQEFVGFDDLNLAPLPENASDTATSSGSSEASPFPREATPETQAGAQPSSTSQGRIPRDENPLDDADDPSSSSESEAASETGDRNAGGKAPSPGSGADARSRERGWVQVFGGKVLDTSGDALASKVWSLHGRGVAWLARSLGVEAAVDMIPKASSGSGALARSHTRWNAALGLRLATPPEERVRFFFTPFLGVLTLKGRFDVGRARDGSRVFSDITVGPNLIYGLGTGVDASWHAWRAGLSASGAVRYSSDKVAVRLLAADAQGGYAFSTRGSDSAAPEIRAFLFARYESFRTEKNLGSLGRKDVETSWAMGGVGAGLAF